MLDDMKDTYKSERQKNYLNDNYSKLKFEYGLDVELLVNDIELIELLLGKLGEQNDYREGCREADITIALLEGDVIDLKNEVFDLNMEISDLRDSLNNKNL